MTTQLRLPFGAVVKAICARYALLGPDGRPAPDLGRIEMVAPDGQVIALFERKEEPCANSISRPTPSGT